MNWFAIVMVLAGLYLALKVAGVVAKLLMLGLVVLGLYWLLGPHFGLPLPF